MCIEQRRGRNARTVGIGSMLCAARWQRRRIRARSRYRTCFSKTGGNDVPTKKRNKVGKKKKAILLLSVKKQKKNPTRH